MSYLQKVINQMQNKGFNENKRDCVDHRRNRSRQRSRDQFRSDRYDRQKVKYQSKWKDNNNNNSNERKKYLQQYGNMTHVVPEVFPVSIGSPKVYLVWKHPRSQPLSSQPSTPRPISLTLGMIKDSHPPLKMVSQSSFLSELKNNITPVEQIWGQLIKQYLNDSEFVEIYRRRNSLSFGEVNYGKSIIRYDGVEQGKKRFYDNQYSQQNIFSRAYFKLWQILSLGVLDGKRQQDIVIANLAEGPGGFIHSLIDFRLKQNKTLQDRYYAITLKIQQGKTRMAKDWSDLRGISFFEKIKSEGFKVKLSYGQTGDGNLYNLGNIESFKSHVMEGREAFLVTADGGIECIGDDQFHYQQIFNAKLFFSEILTCFMINQIGGMFILKIYDIHFQITVQLIMLVSMFYRKVGIIKPLTSRPGNSQKYLLCEGFLGISLEQLQKLKELFKQWQLTQSKLSYFQNSQYLHSILSFSSSPDNQFQQTIRQRIKLINEQLSQQQERKIQQGLKLIENHQYDKQSIKDYIRQHRFPYQLSYAYQWCKKYGLKTINVKVNTEKGQQ